MLQLPAQIPAGFCVTVAALEMQIQGLSHLQDAVTALQCVSSTGCDLSVIQEQCTR